MTTVSELLSFCGDNTSFFRRSFDKSLVQVGSNKKPDFGWAIGPSLDHANLDFVDMNLSYSPTLSTKRGNHCLSLDRGNKL